MMSQKPTGMQSKQKIMIGIISIVFILLVWQVIGMLNGSKSKPAEINPVQAKSHPSITNAQPKAALVATAPVQQSVTPAPVPKAPEVMAQQEVQQKYIESLTELQMLRIKKEIAETNQAITTAKLATATAEKNISDLLTQPAISAHSSESSDNTSPIQKQVSYVVVSVAMQNNKWTAVLKSDGKLYNVSAGDILPMDNSRVVKINRESVILEKDGEQLKLSILSSF